MSRTTSPDAVSSRPRQAAPGPSPAKPGEPTDEVRSAAARLDELLGGAPGDAGWNASTGALGGAAAGLLAPGTSAEAQHLLAFLGGSGAGMEKRDVAQAPALDASGLTMADGLAEPGTARLTRREGDGGRDDDADGGEQESDPGFQVVNQPPPLEASGARAIEAPQEPAASRDPGIADLVDRLAERVLVGQRADGTAEIRLTLRGDVLGGTEVQIARVDGRLELRIDAASEAALRTLRERGDDLVQGLSDRLGGAVVLEVSGRRQQGEGDRNRRSAGHDDILTYVAERG